jgi:hypothetical protein
MSRTLKQLIGLYRNDPDSSFVDLQYQVRVKHDRLLARIDREHGAHRLEDIRTRNLVAWHKAWSTGGKVAMAHSLISRLRVLFRFGFTMLEDQECLRLLNVLSEARFRSSSPRNLPMTAQQANAIRTTAREWFGWDSIALAQALQFELLLGQKDVIGEWVPLSEPGASDVVVDEEKWLRGLRWSDIDDDLILRHYVGSSRRPIEVDLRTAPMVIEELEAMASLRTSSGPLVVCEITAYPWSTAEFRRKWRIVARKAGVPDTVQNRDSLPAGMIVGGPDRARVSQRMTMKRIDYGLRMLRRT